MPDEDNTPVRIRRYPVATAGYQPNNPNNSPATGGLRRDRSMAENHISAAAPAAPAHDKRTIYADQEYRFSKY